MDLAKYAAAVPTVVAVAKVVQAWYANSDRVSALIRDAEKHAKLIKELPENVDKAALESALAAELQTIAEQIEKKAYSEIDGGTVFAMLLVSVVGGGIGFGVWAWAGVVSGWVALLLHVVAILLWVLTAIFVLVGGLPQLVRDRRG